MLTDSRVAQPGVAFAAPFFSSLLFPSLLFPSLLFPVMLTWTTVGLTFFLGALAWRYLSSRKQVWSDLNILSNYISFYFLDHFLWLLSGSLSLNKLNIYNLPCNFIFQDMYYNHDRMALPWFLTPFHLLAAWFRSAWTHSSFWMKIANKCVHWPFNACLNS